MCLACFLVLVSLAACSPARNVPSDSAVVTPDSSFSVIPNPVSSVIPDLVPGLDSSITDHRDGQIYKTVKIGNQTWMAENLNYETESSYCYDDRMSNCLKYGRLYKWTVALDACPAGWHLPDSAEWKTLIDTLGGASAAALPLKSHTGWFYDWSHFGNGTDSSHFSGFPAGMRNGEDDSVFLAMGKSAYFWSSTDILPSYANGVRLHDSVSFDGSHKKNAYSIRCVKDFVRRENNDERRETKDERRENNVVIPDLIGNLLDPRDGQSYRTVKIGNQTWMAENLNFETAASYCYKNLDSNCVKYGRLYTWSNAMEVCPRGWRLPNKEDWETLLKNVGGDKSAGKVLKSQTAWAEEGNGTDDYGFSALPAGERTYFDVCSVKGDYTADHMFKAKVNYDSLGVDANFWSSTKDGDDNVYAMKLHCNMDDASLNSVCGEFYSLSVRCVKE